MHKYNWLKLAMIVLIISSCGKSLPTLENFDQRVWKEDTNACGNKRYAMLESLQGQVDKLLALDEMKIVSLLGKPDRNELYKRNQKFYYYFLQPSEDCAAGAGTVGEAQRLSIRFNAMGLAKEITIE